MPGVRHSSEGMSALNAGTALRAYPPRMALATSHGTRTVQDLVDLHKHGRLNLSPAFQRQSVWSVTDRRMLIMSLFEGIPLPAIYLYRQVAAKGVPVFDVIDGKQRLETVLLFLGKGPLVLDHDPLAVRTAFHEDHQLEQWSWSDLSSQQKNAFLSAKLPTIEVEGDLGEIINLFVRINSTGKRLTAQEKRHAHYHDSGILKAAQHLADEHHDFLLKQRVLSPAQFQRMKHVELMSELLLAVNAGVPLNKKQKIDELIRGKGIAQAEVLRAANDVSRAIKIVRVILPDLKSVRFHQLADFYTLVLLVHRLREEGRAVTAHDSARNVLAGELLSDFGRGVDEVNERIAGGEGVTPLQEPFRRYLATVKEGTDSKKQREIREKLLREVLDGVFDALDTNRTFNTTQRRILWHASADRRCAICSRPITRWEDLSIDHVKPYIKGGTTDLGNAALTHKSCNSSKGAR